MADSPDVPSDNRLFSAAMRGDNTAFALFCQEVLPKLRFHISQLCHSYRLGQDLVGDFCNDTVLKVLEYIKTHPQSSAGRSNPIRDADAWIKTIAGNVVIDFVRKAARLKERPISHPPEAVSCVKMEELVELEDLFGILSPREKEVLKLIYLERLSIEDVAERLEMSVEAVRKAHQRALRRLKGNLGMG